MMHSEATNVAMHSCDAATFLQRKATSIPGLPVLHHRQKLHADFMGSKVVSSLGLDTYRLTNAVI